MTQAQSKLILADLEKGKRITPLDALEDYGCFRLGARIFDLRQSGKNIEREMIELPNGKRIAEYRMGTSS